MIERPYFWLGVPLDATPRPWKEFRWRYGLMPNAYDILSQPGLFSRVRDEGIAKHLDFSGRIALDSGGYQLIRRSDVPFGPDEVLALYRACKPDFGVILDRPFAPGLSWRGRKGRENETLANTRYMTSHRSTDSPILIPVVHGHNPRSLGSYLRRLLRICDPPIVAVGSIVPSIFNVKGAIRTHQAIRALAFIRRQLPNRVLHVFGVGSVMTMHLMYYAGVDSVDSTAWRLKAAYGAIQLPGVSDRNVTGRARKEKYRRLSSGDIRLLDECQCPVCRTGEGLRRLRASFTSRALHNSWIYQQEADLAKRLIRSGEYDSYVESLLGHNPKFGRILDVIKKYRLTGVARQLVA